MKYIDAEKLKAEIETKRELAKNYDMSGGDAPIYDEIILLIDSLQQEQPEVDFEKELDRIWFDNKFGDNFNNSAVDFANVRWICNHFYELGGRLCSK